jgi:Flp pilus assembly protein CpaB
VARSNRLIIVVGVLLAIVAFVGVLAFMGAQQPTSASPENAKQTVLVAATAIEVGQVVSPEMVEAREMTLDAVQGTPISDPSVAAGRTAVFAVAAGAQVTEETFGRRGLSQVDITGQLKPGERAVAFQVDRVTGLNFVVQQGDLIDIVMSADVSVVDVDPETGDTTVPTGLQNQRTVKTVLQAKRVLYVSYSDVQPDEPEASPGAEDPNAPVTPTENVIIVFAGTDQDAELIKFAQRDMGELGSISVTLRAADDTATEETTGVTLDRLITEYGVPAPNVVILPESTPAP